MHQGKLKKFEVKKWTRLLPYLLLRIMVRSFFPVVDTKKPEGLPRVRMGDRSGFQVGVVAKEGNARWTVGKVTRDGNGRFHAEVAGRSR